MCLKIKRFQDNLRTTKKRVVDHFSAMPIKIKLTVYEKPEYRRRKKRSDSDNGFIIIIIIILF